jgi:hypothetical protein
MSANPPSNLPVASSFLQHAMMPQGGESASSAVASQAKAMVESRYIMALRKPRDWDQVRQDVLKECRRPSFANNKSAYYIKPIGDGVEGLGIRFTEVGLRCMTNVLIETTTIFEDADKEIVRVSVTDLEANVTYPMDVRVTKTVERSRPMDDGTYISVRMNKWKKPTYTVPANDEDLLNKRGALISKAQRTLALRLIPGDIQDEAIATIKSVRLDDAARDPGAERKRIADAFGELGVRASELNDYLGHSLDACSPAEMVSLRGIYGAIKDGEATWVQVLENKADHNGEKKPEGGATQGWTPADFGKSLPKWEKLVADGKKTPDEIITMAASKGALSDEQKTAVRALAKKEEKEPPAGDGTGTASPEQLQDIIDKAAKATISTADIRKKFDIPSWPSIPVALVPSILAFIADPMGDQS